MSQSSNNSSSTKKQRNVEDAPQNVHENPVPNIDPNDVFELDDLSSADDAATKINQPHQSTTFGNIPQDRNETETSDQRNANSILWEKQIQLASDTAASNLTTTQPSTPSSKKKHESKKMKKIMKKNEQQKNSVILLFF